jgi:hypothetical protein
MLWRQGAKYTNRYDVTCSYRGTLLNRPFILIRKSKGDSKKFRVLPSAPCLTLPHSVVTNDPASYPKGPNLNLGPETGWVGTTILREAKSYPIHNHPTIPPYMTYAIDKASLNKQRIYYNILLIWTIGILGFDSRWGQGIFLFTTASRTALESTQPPIQWVPEDLSEGKAAGTWSWPLTSIYYLSQRMSGAIPPLPKNAFMAWFSV